MKVNSKYKAYKLANISTNDLGTCKSGKEKRKSKFKTCD